MYTNILSKSKQLFNMNWLNYQLRRVFNNSTVYNNNIIICDRTGVYIINIINECNLWIYFWIFDNINRSQLEKQNSGPQKDSSLDVNKRDFLEILINIT